MAATGTATLTDTGGVSPLRRMTFACTADGSGDVISEPFYFDGEIQGVETIPDGTDVPTAYNLQLRRRSEDGIDILGGEGAGRSATVIEACTPVDGNGNAALAPVRGEALYLTADTVGVGKKFVAHIYGLQHSA